MVGSCLARQRASPWHAAAVTVRRAVSQEHPQAHTHGHRHGLVDRSILRSRAGVRAVSLSLLVLGVTAAVQAAIFLVTDSVALLADLIHNVGDALTALPLGIAFALRSERAEGYAGLAVVLAIFVSACIAAYVAIMRLIHPQAPEHLLALGLAGGAGFVGNYIAAIIRSRAWIAPRSLQTATMPAPTRS